MDLVLGLSMTSTAVRWAVVEGTTAEGATIHRDGIDSASLDDVMAAVGDNRLHAVGVTWTKEAEAEASVLLDALAARDLDNVIAVSEVEAAETLATGIADRAGYNDIAVCVVEPDSALIALVNAQGVTVERIARPLDGRDAVELPCGVIALLDLDDWQPEAVFVVGSADDLDLVMSSIAGLTDSPVYSAAEAALALARGAALASARAVNTLDTPRAPLMSRTAALTSVLVAAVVVFVISLSVAVGLGLTPEADSTPPQVANADAPAPAAPAPSVKEVAPPPVPEAVPPVAKTVAVEVPPVPEVAPIVEPVNEAPAYVPPAPVNEPPAYVPPAPVYTPPAPVYTPPPPVYAPPPPVYVPPAPVYVPPVQPPNYVPAPPPKPRLRDRIIERIPIINRFHEPEYQYPYN